jgi:hypothetical protein
VRRRLGLGRDAAARERHVPEEREGTGGKTVGGSGGERGRGEAASRRGRSNLGPRIWRGVWIRKFLWVGGVRVQNCKLSKPQGRLCHVGRGGKWTGLNLKSI